MATGTGTRIRPKKLNQYIGMGAGVVVLGLLGPIVFGHLGFLYRSWLPRWVPLWERYWMVRGGIVSCARGIAKATSLGVAFAQQSACAVSIISVLLTTTPRIRSSFFLNALVLACFIFASCRHSRNVVPVVAPSSGSPIVLPSGSVLAFRTAEPIEWTQSAPNRVFAAVVSRDLNGNASQLVLPSGSPVTLMVLPTAGQTTSGSWELGLASVMLNGDAFLVRNGISSAANGNGENTGARLGVFAGGVPGTFDKPGTLPPAQGTIELTVAGPKISIPNGSLLTFRLEQELVLVDARH